MPVSTHWNQSPSDGALNIWARLPPHSAFGLLVLPQQVRISSPSAPHEPDELCQCTVAHTLSTLGVYSSKIRL